MLMCFPPASTPPPIVQELGPEPAAAAPIVLEIEWQLAGRSEALKVRGACVESHGERLFVTSLSPFELDPSARGDARPLALADWETALQGGRWRMPDGIGQPTAPAGWQLPGPPARGGLDSWWSDVLLLRWPASAPAVKALEFDPRAPEIQPGGTLEVYLPTAAGGTPEPRTLEVLAVNREAGLPVVELLLGWVGPESDVAGLPLLDQSNRVRAIASGLERTNSAPGSRPVLRAQLLDAAWQQPPALVLERLPIEFPAGVFDLASNTGDVLLLSSSVFDRTWAFNFRAQAPDAAWQGLDFYHLAGFSPDGLFAVAAHPVRGIEWFDAAGLESLSGYGRLAPAPTARSFSPDGSRLFTASADGGLWELILGTSETLEISKEPVDLLLATAESLWSVGTDRRRLRRYRLPAPGVACGPAEEVLTSREAIQTLAGMGDTGGLLIGTASALLCLDAETLEKRFEQPLPGGVRALCWDPNGQTLLAAGGREVRDEADDLFVEACFVWQLDGADGRVLAQSQSLRGLPFGLTGEPGTRAGQLVLDQRGRIHRIQTRVLEPAVKAE